MVCIVYIFVLFQATKMCCISLKFVQFLFQYCYFSFAVIDSPYSIFLFYLSTFLISGGEAFHSSPLFVPFALALCLAYCLSFSLHPSNSPLALFTPYLYFNLSILLPASHVRLASFSVSLLFPFAFVPCSFLLLSHWYMVFPSNFSFHRSNSKRHNYQTPFLLGPIERKNYPNERRIHHTYEDKSMAAI